MTFGQATGHFVADLEHRAPSAQSVERWRRRLVDHAVPALGGLDVAALGTEDVLRVLQPLWGVRTETATRVRAGIQAVLAFAAQQGWRNGPNPAIWRGNLDLVLPSPAAVKRVRPARTVLGYPEIPAFLARLEQRTATAARALSFAILTAATPAAVRLAAWQDIDLDTGTWTIPPSGVRGTPHRVPLSVTAKTLVEALPRRDGLLFPADREVHQPLSDMAMLRLLRRLGRRETPQRFRSTFRHWATLEAGASSDVVESALAFKAALRREAASPALYGERVSLMSTWGRYCADGAGRAACGEGR
ncbi:MAG: integrase [Reyranellaceae bacterium]